MSWMCARIWLPVPTQRVLVLLVCRDQAGLSWRTPSDFCHLARVWPKACRAKLQRAGHLRRRRFGMIATRDFGNRGVVSAVPSQPSRAYLTSQDSLGSCSAQRLKTRSVITASLRIDCIRHCGRGGRMEGGSTAMSSCVSRLSIYATLATDGLDESHHESGSLCSCVR